MVVELARLYLQARSCSLPEIFFPPILKPQFACATGRTMAGLSGALALLAFGSAVQASPCKLHSAMMVLGLFVFPDHCLLLFPSSSCGNQRHHHPGTDNDITA